MADNELENTEQTEEQIEQQETDDFESGFAGNEELPASTDKDADIDDDNDPDKKQDQEQEQGSNKPEDQSQPGEQQSAKPEFVPLSEFEKLSSRMRNIEGNIGGIKSALSRMSNRDQQQASNDAADAAKAVGANAPTKQQTADALRSGESFDKLAEEFPEWAAAMKELVALNSQASANIDTDAILQQADERSATKLEALRSQIVESRHRGWSDLVKTPEFNDWFSKQSDEVKALGESENPVDVIDVLDRYATDRKQPSKQTPGKNTSTRRLEQALAPTTGRSVSTTSTPSEEDDFQAGFKTRN